jgi:diguanylate cyclase
MQETYNQTIDDAKKFAAEAIARLDTEGLPATPDMFELFFAYYSANHSEVVRSIDIMVGQKFELTLERCQELYRRLLNSDASQKTLEKAEKIVTETLSDVDGMMDDVQTSTTDFSGSISKINDGISEAVKPEDMKKLLDDMMSETQKMVSENQALEQKLAKSSTSMQSLKQEMEHVREQAFTDALTGIANRKKFDLETVRYITEARDEGKPLSLVFMDIDHFKNFNDTYGHQIGDQVLRLVAKCLKDGVKGQDFPCRYGGEEFVVILPETDISGAEKIANILRESVKAKEIRNRATGETLSRVSMSAGVAVLGADEDPKDWIERADKALYRAKKMGRDRVEKAKEPI